MYNAQEAIVWQVSSMHCCTGILLMNTHHYQVLYLFSSHRRSNQESVLIIAAVRDHFMYTAISWVRADEVHNTNGVSYAQNMNDPE